MNAKQRKTAAEDTVKVLNSALRSAYLNANKYWEKIAEIAEQLSPNNTYEETIKSLNVQFEYENNFAALNKLFANLDSIRDTMETISEILSSKELARGAMYNRSQTYANELFTIESAYRNAVEKFHSVAVDPIILAFDEVIPLSELEKLPLNQFIIALIKRFSREEGLSDTLRTIVEKHKDELLGVSRCSGFLARNGLTPAYFGEPSGNYVVIPGDVTYDLRPLVDPDFIVKHDLILKQDAGLGRKTIEKYTTILPSKPTKIIPVDINVGDDSDEFRVWMKIGDSYRALVRGRKSVFTRRDIESLFSVTNRPARYYEMTRVDPTDPMYQFYADKYAVAKLDISDDIIRRRLFDEFIDRHNAMKLANFHKVATDRELISEVIVKVLNEVIVKSNNPDVMCGYIIRYEALIREFVNMIDKEIKNIRVSHDVLGHLRDLYRKVIDSISWTGFEPSFKEMLAQT